MFNKVVPVCWYGLERYHLTDRLPLDVKKKMEDEVLLIRNQNELRNIEAAKFLGKFRKANIPVAILKGVMLGEVVYQNPYYKRMNDIDILVKKEDIDAIYEIYDSLDYFYIGERISGSRKKSDKVSHLSPPFVSRDLTCVIGTQWGIKTPLSPYKINYKAIWERKRPLQFRQLEVSMLSPEDNLHHLCLHLGYFKISLRDMMDIYNLLRYYQHSFDWTLFYSIVVESGSEDPVFFALAISEYLFSTNKTQDFLYKIKGRVKGSTIKAVTWKTRSMDVFLNLHSDHIQSIEKMISEFDTTEYFVEKWRSFCTLWGFLLIPAREEVIHMSALYKPSALRVFWARITIPFKIFRVIMSEIGWVLTVLLMFKTVIDLTVTLAKAPFTKKKNKNRAAYAGRLGVNLDDLRRLKEGFQ